MPTPDRAGGNLSACDGDTGDFHSQNSKISVFTNGVVVEAVVGISQEQLRGEFSQNSAVGCDFGLTSVTKLRNSVGPSKRSQA